MLSTLEALATHETSLHHNSEVRSTASWYSWRIEIKKCNSIMTLTWSFIKFGPHGHDITVSLSSTGVLKKNEWPQLPLSNSWTDELRILRLFSSHQFSCMTVWAGLFNCAKNIRRLTGPCHVPTQWGSTSQPADISDDGGKEKMDWHVSWEQAKEIRDTGPVVMYLLGSSKAGLHDVCHTQG
jgi:hypothetical protein